MMDNVESIWSDALIPYSKCSTDIFVGLGEATKIPAENLTQNLPNTSLLLYRYTNPFDALMFL
jgi:hypothetical protein